MIWVEFIGLWASGKSGHIERLKHELSKSGYEITTIHSYFGLSRWRTYYEVVSLLLQHPSVIYYSLKLYILVRKSSDFGSSNLSAHLLRTLVKTYIFRQIALRTRPSDVVLWEGEFHILPLILDESSITPSLHVALEQFFPVNDMEFIVLDVSCDISLNRIQDDYESGSNIRFNSKQYNHLKHTLRSAKANELALVAHRSKSGSSVRQFDTNSTGWINSAHLLTYIKSKLVDSGALDEH